MSAVGGVLVVTGVGGMGAAVAHRLGCGRTVVLADVDARVLAAVGGRLGAEGYRVVEQVTDVSDAGSVRDLARVAGGAGRVDVVVHTAGLSPVQAPPDAILRV